MHTPPPTIDRPRRRTHRGHAHHDDEELLAAVRRGDLEAYGELYRRYEGEVRRFARTLVSADEVNDLTSEAFAKMLRALLRAKGPVDHPIRYLMVTTRTSAVSLRRARQRQDDIRQRARAHHHLHDEPMLDGDALLFDAFAQLTPRWRTVLWWNIVEDLSPKEIGERTGASAAAISTLLHRAKRALRAEYAARVAAAEAADAAAAS